MQYRPSLIAFAALLLVSRRIADRSRNSQDYLEVVALLRKQTIYELATIEQVVLELENSERHCVVSQVFQETRIKYTEDETLSRIVPLLSN